MAKDLLLEIGTEEIPAKFMPGALAQIEDIAKGKFSELRIECGEIKALGTPRRLVLIVRDVAEAQQDKKSENKGPSVKIAYDANGNPTKAAQGFARGQGIDPEQLIVKDGYVYALTEETGKVVKDLLPEILTDFVNSLNFPKNMRWGSLDMRFVRPIRWLVALFGQEIVPFTVAQVTAGNITRGHRFLSKGEFSVESVDDYLAKLSLNHVMVDQDVRRQVIKEQVEKLAIAQGGIAEIDEDLLEEVVYLVEYPTALCGRFEKKYLSLPPEAVITPMREHQRYFPVFSKEGKLLPVFITVRNGGLDYIDIVQHGNERVLKARLADAQFFFEEDKKVPLSKRVDKLKTIVFQDGLGTMYDKTKRLEALSAYIAKEVGVTEEELPNIARAAYLAKADLVTGVVCEFTELQGVMGKEYALIHGEPQEVAEAIFEHYLPRFAGDILPKSIGGRAVSIADKIDNIVGTFSRGLIPTGSQDPYALRRQALGAVNIIIDGQYDISLVKLLERSMELLGIEQSIRGKLLGDIQEFFRLRLKSVLADEGVRYDILEAIMNTNTDYLYNTYVRGKALAEMNNSTAMVKAVQAFTRAGNLAKNAVYDKIDTSLFNTEAEHNLYNAYLAARQKIDILFERKGYKEMVTVMAEMAVQIDAFFGAVMVMVPEEEVKNNRLALLKAITGLTANVADLSKIIV